MPTFVGLDVHLRTCHATMMDEQGRILKQEKFPNERREFERIFNGVDDAKVALLAAGLRVARKHGTRSAVGSSAKDPHHS